MDTVAGVSAADVCLGSLEYELVVADWLLPDGDGVAVADKVAALGVKTHSSSAASCRSCRAMRTFGTVSSGRASGQRLLFPLSGPRSAVQAVFGQAEIATLNRDRPDRRATGITPPSKLSGRIPSNRASVGEKE